MDIPSFVFRNVITTKGFSRKVWLRARHLLIRWLDDPTCTMQIHGRRMKVNLSHQLPVYQSLHPYYDTLPRRLAVFLQGRHGALRCVDVGANIGDSVAAFIDGDKDHILAVEPNPKFFNLLKANWAGDARLTLIDTICSSGSQSASFTILEKNGTASIVESQGGTSMKQQSLDEIIAAHPMFGATNLIKIDTDGHDFEVLAGAARTIAANRPAVLFECDVFGRVDYTECVLRTLEMFMSCSYSHCLVYDNRGYLIGRYALDDHATVKSLLFYQLTSDFQYFDLLVMTEPDLAAFQIAEVRFFADERVAASLRQTALSAGSIAAPGAIPA
jgi:FkbM family methyltransferase